MIQHDMCVQVSYNKYLKDRLYSIVHYKCIFDWYYWMIASYSNSHYYSTLDSKSMWVVSYSTVHYYSIIDCMKLYFFLYDIFQVREYTDCCYNKLQEDCMYIHNVLTESLFQ